MCHPAHTKIRHVPECPDNSKPTSNHARRGTPLICRSKPQSPSVCMALVLLLPVLLPEFQCCFRDFDNITPGLFVYALLINKSTLSELASVPCRHTHMLSCSAIVVLLFSVLQWPHRFSHWLLRSATSIQSHLRSASSQGFACRILCVR